MKFGKVFKVFKKGAKAASKRQGKAAAAAGDFEWPTGVRIGVYGHDNSGKTVYFTVLNEECKVSRNLQISVTDNATAAEFLANYRRIWGVGTKADIGTVVDLREEKKFPDPTKRDKVFQFNAIIDRKKKVPVVTYDYDGQAVSISGEHELSEKVIDFMSGCNGILFFYDPKMLGSEAHTQAQVASFVNFLEQLAPLDRRLPIPVALVVTKADILPGFSSESQTILIGGEDEHFFAEDYDVFLDRVLSSNKIASNSAWAGSVREILVKLKEYLKVVVGRTLDFQIFFVSSTGQTPEKIGADVGRSIYAPPARMSPVGVKEPFYWLLNSIRRSRRVSRIRALAKYAALLSLVWIVAFSLPNLYHFQFLLSRATRVEDNILRLYDNNKLMVSSKERSKIMTTYDRYEHAWIVKWFFDRFRVAAGQLREQYRGMGTNAAKAELNRVIARLSNVVRDENLWPKRHPSSDSLVLDSIHMEVETSLNSFRQWDDTSTLYTRSGRALTYWGLFKESIGNPAGSDSAWKKIVEQIGHDNDLYGRDLSHEEKALCEVLMEAALARQQMVVETQTVQKASTKFEQLIFEINEHQGDHEYLLDKAVRELEKLRGSLRGDPAKQGVVDSINDYLSRAAYFDENRQYKFKLINCPPNHHVHIKVTGRGKSADWPRTQLHPSSEFSITWRAGDHILIALHAKHVGDDDESWGEPATELHELAGRFSIFELDGTISFNSGQVTASCQDDLKENLPKF